MVVKSCAEDDGDHHGGDMEEEKKGTAMWRSSGSL